MELFDDEEKNSEELDKEADNDSIEGFRKHFFISCAIYQRESAKRDFVVSLIFCMIEAFQSAHFAINSATGNPFYSNAHNYFLASSLQSFNDALALYPWLLTISSASREIVIYFAVSLALISLIIALLMLKKSFHTGCLRYVAFWLLDLISTVLFIPLAGALFVAIGCKDVNGSSMSLLYDGIMCFDGKHFILALLSVFSLLILLMLSTIYKLLIVPQEISTAVTMSRISNFSEFISHMMRILFLIVFLILKDILIAPALCYLLYFGGELYALISYGSVGYYINEEVYYMIKTIISAKAWISFISMLSSLIEVNFSCAILGGIVIVLPLIFCLFGSYRSLSQMQLLAISPDSLLTEEQCLQFSLGLSRLILCLKKQKNIETQKIILNHFLAKHFRYCSLGHCPLTNLKSKMTTLVTSERNETIQRLTLWCCRTTRKLIAKYPNSTEIRLHYMRIVLYILQSNAQTTTAFQSISKLNRDVVTNFKIFYFRQALNRQKETEINKTGESALMIMALKGKKAEKKLFNNIGIASELYSRFWDTVQDNSPNFDLFLRYGFKTLRVHDKIDKIWAAMEKKKLITQRMITFYSEFCLAVENDQEKAVKVMSLDASHNTSSKNNILVSYSPQGEGVVAISAKSSNLGMIKMCNSAFCSMSGYSREELLGMKIEALMPMIYKEHHTTQLLQCCRKIEGGEEVFCRGKNIYMVNKGNDLISVKMRVVEVPHFLNSYMFIASFTYIHNEIDAPSFILLMDNNKNIVDVSSSCLFYLGWNNERLKDTAVHLKDIIPSCNEIPEDEEHTTRFVSSLSTSESPNIKFDEQHNILPLNENSSDFKDATGRCILNKLRSEKKNDMGYSLKMWVRRKKEGLNSSPKFLDYNCSESQFIYSPEFNKFIQHSVRESRLDILQEGISDFLARSRSRASPSISGKADNVQESSNKHENNEMTFAERIRQTHNPNSFYGGIANQLLLKEREEFNDILIQLSRKPDFSKDVSLYRIDKCRGSVMVSDEAASALASKDILSNTLLDDKRSHKTELNLKTKIFANSIKSKEYLHRLISTLPFPTSFLCFFMSVTLNTCVTLSVAVILFYLMDNVFVQVSKEFRLINLSMNSTFQLIAATSWTLQATNFNTRLLMKNASYPKYIEDDDLHILTIVSLEDILKQYRSTLLEREAEQFIEGTNNEYNLIVNYSFQDTQSYYKECVFENACWMAHDALYNITHFESLKSFNFQNSLLMSFEYNARNTIEQGFDKTVSNFNTNFHKRFMDTYQQALTVAYCLYLIIFLSSSLLVVILWRIYSTLFTEAAIFLKVPNKTCREQYLGANNFLIKLKNCQMNFDSFISDNDSNIELETDEADSSDNREKVRDQSRDNEVWLGIKKSFARSCQFYLSFIWRFLFTLGIICGYLIGTLFVSLNHRDLLVNVEKLANTTTKLSAVYALCESSAISFFTDDTIKVAGNPAEVSLLMYTERMYDEVFKMIEYSNVIISILSDSEKTRIESFLHHSMCADDYPYTCLDPVGEQGYISLMSEYAHVLRRAYVMYTPKEHRNIGLNSPEMVRISEIAYTYLLPGIQYLMAKLEKAVLASNDNLFNTFLSLLIIYSIVIFFLMGLLWVPYGLMMRSVYMQTRLLLTMIPIQVISQIKAFQERFSGILFAQKH